MVLAVTGAAVLVVVGVGLALFQPWQLFLDTRVDDAAPAGASVIETTAVPSSFVSLDKSTRGAVTLLADDSGRRYVRFEELDTSKGPDVRVYLSTNAVDGPESAFDDDYVELGGLQGNLGNQNYEIPAGTELDRFRSVVIWCDRFDSAFGAAALA